VHTASQNARSGGVVPLAGSVPEPGPLVPDWNSRARAFNVTHTSVMPTHAALSRDAKRTDSRACAITSSDPLSCVSLPTGTTLASFALGALSCSGSSSETGARALRAQNRGSAAYRKSLHSASTTISSSDSPRKYGSPAPHTPLTLNTQPAAQRPARKTAQTPSKTSVTLSSSASTPTRMRWQGKKLV